MKKYFLLFILPACVVLISFMLVFSFLILEQPVTSISSKANKFIIIACLASVFVTLQILYFCWRGLYLQSKFLSQLTKISQRFNNGSFAQRFNYADDQVSEVSELSHSLNFLMSKAEKRMVALQQQSFEKQAVLSSMSEAVIAVNKSESIYLMNQAAADLFNVDYFSSSDKMLAEVVRIPKLYNQMVESIQKAETIDRSFRIDASLLGRDKKNMFLQLKSSPIKGRKKQNIGSVFVFSNNTKIKELEKHRTNFVGNVSHELKTPLTLIQGFSETLIDNPDLSVDDKKKYMEVIHKHSSRLGNLIDDLLAISKLENADENSTLDFDLINLGTLIRNAMSLCQEKAKAKKISLGFKSKQTDLTKKMNASLFEQALVNLVDNAIKHSPEGAHVEVCLTSNDQQILIEVKDQGQGMEAKHLDHIFERFYRVDKGRSRGVGGTGLGLSIVKHVAQLHGGKVSVSSEVGQGSQFKVELPRW